jgi:phytoene synthase
LIERGFEKPRFPVKLGKASRIAILLQYAII